MSIYHVDDDVAEEFNFQLTTSLLKVLLSSTVMFMLLLVEILKGHSHEKIPPFCWSNQKAYIFFKTFSNILYQTNPTFFN